MSVARPAIKAVLIDLDGTLLDTVPDLHAAANGMLADLGRPPVAVADDPRLCRHAASPSWSSACWPARSMRPTTPRRRRDDALSSFKKHYAEVNGRSATPFPGVIAGSGCLQGRRFAAGRDHQQGARLHRAAARTHRLGRPISSSTVSGDSLPRRSRDPMPLLHACDRLGVSPAETLHDRRLAAMTPGRRAPPAARCSWCPTATTRARMCKDSTAML